MTYKLHMGHERKTEVDFELVVSLWIDHNMFSGSRAVV